MNRADRLSDLAPQSLDHATALPARWYVQPATVAIDRRAIFDRGWQLIAHVCQLQDAGDHVIGDFAGLPVIAVRGADGVIRVFHNVCRHRAGPIATCDGLAARSLRCRYHGWTYDLAGRLRGAPEFEGVEEFDRDRQGLPEIAVAVWGPFVWAHMPVEENCLSCHNSHGSNIPKLLTVKVPQLCQDCHGSAHGQYAYGATFGIGGANQANSARFMSRSCVNCHQMIHGSNAPASRGHFLLR